MRNSQIALRYAKALYSLASEKKEQDLVSEQMRVVESAFRQDPAITDFLNTPLIRPSDKVKAIEGMVSVIPMADVLKNFLSLLAKKTRLTIFSDIVGAYQVILDEANGVTRGIVRSAAVLGPEERNRISELVSRATKKQVILTYKEDQNLLGGLVAEVGSYTFDDSLISHLKRINEQLTRSSH